MTAVFRLFCTACLLLVAAAATQSPSGAHTQSQLASDALAVPGRGIDPAPSGSLHEDTSSSQRWQQRQQRQPESQWNATGDTRHASLKDAWQQQRLDGNLHPNVDNSSTSSSSLAGAAHSGEQVTSQTHGGTYRDGLTGGKPPVQPVCSSIPGCQSCPNTATCDLCWYNYGVARFVRTNTGRCRCPPGYGARAGTTPNARDTPEWADKCLPCPPGYYSRGGPIGAAKCEKCPAGKTSFGASASCNVPETCLQGQQPAPQPFFGCVPCPVGTWQSVLNSQLPCNACPDGWTTPSPGAVSPAQCTVPICPAGTQLVTGPINGFVCQSCTGLDYSTGGLQEQGVAGQLALCKQCPTDEVPTSARDECSKFICPPPDVFRIDCISSYMPPAATSKVVPGQILNNICQGFPEGTEITWYPESSAGLGFPDWGNPLEVARVPIPVAPGKRFYPAITSFSGRTDCLCPDNPETTNCRFEDAAASAKDYSGTTVQPAPYWYVST